LDLLDASEEIYEHLNALVEEKDREIKRLREIIAHQQEIIEAMKSA
jgi:hypothetical protein